MFEKATLMWMYAEHPVHAGSGSGVGAIDLPIQRERVTGWPIIQPSGLKGALREYFDGLSRGAQANNADFKEKMLEVFGPDESAIHSGAASFTEAKVLLFPVRSLKGTFAYVTCPLALTRFQRDMETLKDCDGTDLLASQGTRPQFPDFSNGTPATDTVWVAAEEGNDSLRADSLLTIKTGDTAFQVIFEELSFDAQPYSDINFLGNWLKCAAGSLPWLDQANLARRLVVVSDDVFKDFVEMSTEVITRNRINNETGTAEDGGLWNEENLPRETVLYSTVFAASPFKPERERKLADAGAVLGFLTDDQHAPKFVWVGGNTTVGRGIVRLAFVVGP